MYFSHFRLSTFTPTPDINAHVYRYTHRYIHVCYFKYIYIKKNVYTWIYTFWKSVKARLRLFTFTTTPDMNAHACMYTWIYTCISSQTHMYTHTYTYIYIYIYTFWLNMAACLRSSTFTTMPASTYTPTCKHL